MKIRNDELESENQHLAASNTSLQNELFKSHAELRMLEAEFERQRQELQDSMKAVCSEMLSLREQINNNISQSALL